MIFGIDISIFIFLVLCLFLVAIFEFINGFHDTANAVAPVIYTKSLKARYAVLLAGIMNFLGVFLGGIGVAMAIIYLLPLEAISYQSTSFGIIVVISLLLSAIIWNFLTWYFGIPASSSHSLIGAILGVTISMLYIPMNGNIQIVPNWDKAIEVIESLLFSPFLGFILASIIMLFLYRFIKSRYYFSTPSKRHKNPKKGLRLVLILTSAWVSFAHGSNDGQKGVGLAMLILVLLVPNIFAINPNINKDEINKNIISIETSLDSINSDLLNKYEKEKLAETILNIENIKQKLNNNSEFDKNDLRKEVLTFKNNINLLEKTILKDESKLYLVSVVNSDIGDININKIDTNITSILSIINYAPIWVILLISVSLGLGTMIGWKRIVVTIGEKIGNTDMNYAQATTSALITAMTITIASRFHLPVSTTHILSSSVAGTMSVGSNRSGVRGGTIRNILTAWILTLPVTMFLSGFIFLILWYIVIK
ncbi:MAG: inorganic phosphate transporter [Candidatus Gracilibacteria bacterium]|nr:inorganic phosphate transporter [Candidatus Gracilibacteria bacterium]